jgi:hypothetical protein
MAQRRLHRAQKHAGDGGLKPLHAQIRATNRNHRDDPRVLPRASDQVVRGT